VTLLVILWIYQRLARAVLLPRQASRAYRKNADMQAERMLTWDGDSFTSRTAHGRATLKWHDIVSILQDQTNLLLFISKTEFLVVPQRAFTAGTRAALLSHLPHAQPAHPAL